MWHAVNSSGGGFGPVVDGLGLCSWMFPPAKKRVVTTTASPTPSFSIFRPNLSGPFGPDPGSPPSKVRARKKIDPKRFEFAVPQISRYVGGELPQTLLKQGSKRSEERRVGNECRS